MEFKLPLVSLILSISLPPIYAASAINLRDKDVSILSCLQASQGSPKSSGFLRAGQPLTNTPASIQQAQVHKDFNQVKHIRLHQTFEGLSIWGADAVMHLAQPQKKTPASLNGIFYQDLQNDLNYKPQLIFDPNQKAQALEKFIKEYTDNHIDKNIKILQKKHELIIYIDQTHRAHYAFHLSFYGKMNGSPINPHRIVDAISLKSYVSWSDIKKLSLVDGGGYGGNPNTGRLFYDGLQGHLPTLKMQREGAKNICYLKNSEVNVTDFRFNETAKFYCQENDPLHNHVYWDALGDLTNGGYSPNHDALYAGQVVQQLYKKWYGVAPLMENNQPMLLTMVTHSPNLIDGISDPDNAYWDSIEKKMYFGDGEKQFYPLTSVGIAAHEISHGFTEQHANLYYYDEQSGGLNESFSDMAAQAAEFFVTGHNNWQIAADVSKEKNSALRFMDEPTKDCYGRQAGNNCSIAHIRDLRFGLSVHHTSGVFNRAFYLLATSPGWTTKTAFDVMVKANQDYWTPLTTFQEAACGVMNAVRDYHYDLSAPVKAFAAVGISVSQCV